MYTNERPGLAGSPLPTPSASVTPGGTTMQGLVGGGGSGNGNGGPTGNDLFFSEAVKAGFFPNTAAGRSAFDVYTSTAWPSGPVKDFPDFAGWVMAAALARQLLDPSILYDPNVTTPVQVQQVWNDRYATIKLYTAAQFGLTPSDVDQFLAALNSYLPFWSAFWHNDIGTAGGVRNAPTPTLPPVTVPDVPTFTGSVPPAIQLYPVAAPVAPGGLWPGASATPLVMYGAIRRIDYGLDASGIQRTPSAWAPLPRGFLVRPPFGGNQSSFIPTAPGYPSVPEWEYPAGARGAVVDALDQAAGVAVTSSTSDLGPARVQADEAALWAFLQRLPEAPILQAPPEWGIVVATPAPSVSPSVSPSTEPSMMQAPPLYGDSPLPGVTPPSYNIQPNQQPPSVSPGVTDATGVTGPTTTGTSSTSMMILGIAILAGAGYALAKGKNRRRNW